MTVKWKHWESSLKVIDETHPKCMCEKCRKMITNMEQSMERL